MGSREITLWLDERWVTALEEQLKGKTLSKHLEEYLNERIRQLPKQVYEQISSEIREEDLRRQEEWEASRRFSVFHIRGNGTEQYLETNGAMEFLDMAKVLRDYLRQNEKQSFGSGWKPISLDEFKTYAAERLDNTGRIAGAFDIDFDKGEIAALNIMDGWQKFRIKDVSTAVYHAMRRSCLNWNRRFEIFLDRLEGKQIPQMDEEKQEQSPLAEMQMQGGMA